MVGIVTLAMSACGGGGGDGGGNAPANAIAHAGDDQFTTVSKTVTLDGSASTDPDGDTLTYKWKQIDGPDVTNGAFEFTGVNPVFNTPESDSKISFELLVNDGHGDSAPDVVDIYVLTEKVSNITVDPKNQLPASQAVLITQHFLENKFSAAFTKILNSPDDSLNLSIEGKITVPLPIPYVPTGLFNGGIAVAKAMEVIAVKQGSDTFYDVSFERDKGISLGVGVPGLPSGIEVSAGQTISYSTTEVFRFKTPADAAKGMMNYFVLKGLWKELSKLSLIGIDVTDVAGLVVQIKDYISTKTGFDFSLTITTEQLNALLEAAKLAVVVGEIAVDGGQTALDGANIALGIAQAAVDKAQDAVVLQQGVVDLAQWVYDNCIVGCKLLKETLDAEKAILGGLKGVLSTANNTLKLAKADVQKASDKLKIAKSKLAQAKQDIVSYQAQLATLPDSTSIDIFTLALNQLVSDIEFLNQRHYGSTAAISRAISIVAKADVLGGIEGSRGRNFKLSYNAQDNTLSVAILFSAEAAVEAIVPGILVDQTLALKRDNGIGYELVFGFNNQTQIFELQDSGTFTLYADLSGSLSGNLDIFHKVAGAGIKPIIEFKPTDEMAEFGANATGIIDITPIIDVVSTFPIVDPQTLGVAVTSTVESFMVDELIAAIAAQTLPLKVKLYRTAGFESNIGAGNSSVMTGELNTAAGWTDYADTLDYSSMTIIDFADAIFGGEGLLANLQNLISVIQDAYQDVAPIK